MFRKISSKLEAAPPNKLLTLFTLLTLLTLYTLLTLLLHCLHGSHCLDCFHWFYCIHCLHSVCWHMVKAGLQKLWDVLLFWADSPSAIFSIVASQGRSPDNLYHFFLTPMRQKIWAGVFPSLPIPKLTQYIQFVKSGQKIWAGPYPPSFGQNLKEQLLFLGRPSLSCSESVWNLSLKRIYSYQQGLWCGL